MSFDDILAAGSCVHCGEYAIEGTDNTLITDEGFAHTWCEKEYNDDIRTWSLEDAAIDAAREKEDKEEV